MKSNFLRIQITVSRIRLINLTLAANAVANLANLVPSHIRVRLVEYGIDLAATVERVKASGYAPCDLIKLEMGGKHIHLWLE